MNVIAPFILTVAISSTVLSCSQSVAPSPVQRVASASFAQPGHFLTHLLDVARRGDKEAWALQLAPPRRARGDDYITRHFEAWRPDLLALDRVIATSEAVLIADGARHILGLKRADGRIDRVMRVSFWDGRLRIDEN